MRRLAQTGVAARDVITVLAANAVVVLAAQAVHRHEHVVAGKHEKLLRRCGGSTYHTPIEAGCTYPQLMCSVNSWRLEHRSPHSQTNTPFVTVSRPQPLLRFLALTL